LESQEDVVWPENSAIKFGWQKALFVASGFLFTSSLVCGLAWSTGSLIFFRWMGGADVNISLLVCSFYISEVPPARLGGRKVKLFQLASCIGIVEAIVTNTGLLS
jgi:hypothetical protein